MEEKIYLKAAAKLVYQLGEQLIENELVALLELIKNSYDADSTTSRVIVNTEEITPYGRGKIIIKDNGHGMLPSILKNSFFKISTSFREKNRYSFKFNRQVLGEKGLGRLSFQRLGYFVRIITKPDLEILKNLITQYDLEILKKYKAFELIIDWTKLDDTLELNEVSAIIKGLTDDKELGNSGTIIEILGIRNLEFWNSDKGNVETLVKEIYKMNSPFSTQEADKFKIIFRLNETLYRNDEVDEKLLEKLADNKIEFEVKNLVLKIRINYSYKHLLSLLQRNAKSFENFKLLKADEEGLKSLLCDQIEIDLTNEDEKDYIKYIKKLNLKKINGNYADPGDFKGKIYNVRFTNENKSDITEILQEESLNSIQNSREFKRIWDLIKGLYIYRNSFRVLPYGNQGMDWAGFDTYAKTVKYMPYEYKSILGYIILSGKKCRNLKEQTNRQGFILDEYGENFINIIKQVLVTIVCDRYVSLREGFSLKSQNIKSNILESKNGLLKLEKIVSSREELDKNIFEVKNMIKIGERISKVEPLLEQIEKIEEVVEKYSKELSQDRKILNLKKEEMSLLIPMVGQSIIVESMTHEFTRIASNITMYAKQSLEEFEKIKLENLNLKKWQKSILNEILFLKNQLNHIEPTYNKRIKEKTKINLKEFLEEMYLDDSPMAEKAKKLKINVKIIGEDFTINANKGELITIFDNLFLNSLYWVNIHDKEREIKIEIKPKGEVIFEDTGCGIAEEYRTLIFNPFFTLKPDGRGLGLYIVEGLLREMDAYIKLSSSVNSENRLNKFIIKFEKIEQNFVLF